MKRNMLIVMFWLAYPPALFAGLVGCLVGLLGTYAMLPIIMLGELKRRLDRE